MANCVSVKCSLCIISPSLAMAGKHRKCHTLCAHKPQAVSDRFNPLSSGPCQPPLTSSSSSSLGSRCVPWLGEGLSLPSPNYHVLYCLLPYRVAPVFVQVVSPPLGWSPLSSFLVIWSLEVVSGEVHRLSLRRLICPAQDHFIFITVYIISMTFVLSLSQMLVRRSLYVILSILLSILVCAATILFWACLVSVQVSAPYVIAGSTHELYTCLFRQMARLLLKISRCLAYAAQPAIILRCISLSWFFSLRL